jgi:hypothetical protein
MYHVRLYAHRPPCVMQRPSEQNRTPPNAEQCLYRPHGYHERPAPSPPRQILLPPKRTSIILQRRAWQAVPEAQGSPRNTIISKMALTRNPYTEYSNHTPTLIPSTGGGNSHLSIPSITPGSSTHDRRSSEGRRERYTAVSDRGCHADGGPA